VGLFDLGEWRRPERRRPFPEKWIRLGRSDRLRLLFFGAREKPQYQDEGKDQKKKFLLPHCRAPFYSILTGHSETPASTED
jgi:hypothetical protein